LQNGSHDKRARRRDIFHELRKVAMRENPLQSSLDHRLGGTHSNELPGEGKASSAALRPKARLKRRTDRFMWYGDETTAIQRGSGKEGPQFLAQFAASFPFSAVVRDSFS
jgi:hypothetical protein